jgi:hypothetical protein
MSIFFVLPPATDWTFKPIYDLRERYERRLDKDFSETGSDNRSDLFSRWRVGVDFGYKKDFTGKLVYQYAHDLFWLASGNASEERSDVFLAYVDFNGLGGKVRLGRQQLVLGTERLLGPSDWGNTGRSFDMARWTGKNIDLFAGRLAVNGTPSKDAQIAGGFLQSRYGDSLFVFKHDEKGASHDDIYTLDHVFKAKKGKWSGDLELAGQMGRKGNNKLEAWATGLKVNYQKDEKWKFYGEAAAASGGHRGDTSLTFDQLYASNHSRYGIMDMQGWRNMSGLSLGAQYKPTKTWTLNAEFHSFGLWAANDSWYSDGGRANSGSTDSSGNSGRNVGQEFDFWTSYNIDSKSTLEAGVGVFKPGNFIKSFANKGDRDQVWGYLQYRIRF